LTRDQRSCSEFVIVLKLFPKPTNEICLRLPLQLSCHGATSRDVNSRHENPVRRKRREEICGGGADYLREVSAYSRDQPECASVAALWDQSGQERLELSMAVDEMPRCLRKACNLPVLPRSPTASCHPTSFQFGPRPGQIRPHVMPFRPTNLPAPFGSSSALWSGFFAAFSPRRDSDGSS